MMINYSRRTGVVLFSCIAVFFGCLFLAFFNLGRPHRLLPALKESTNNIPTTTTPTATATAISDESSRACEDVLGPLRQHIEIPPRVQYAKRVIQAKTVSNHNSKSTMVHLHDKLLDGGFTKLDLESRECTIAPSTRSPIVIEASEKAPPVGDDAAKLLFGASTTLKRLNKAIPHMIRWLGDSAAEILVVIEDSKPGMDLQATEARIATDANINIKVLPRLDESDENHGQRHFRLVQALNRHRKPHHEWFVAIDDDTFFPSIRNLLAALQPYDTSEAWYIGSLSEDFASVKGVYGYMAYGGAGIFMTLPLLESLDTHFDECNDAHHAGGDMLYRDCAFLHISPPVTLTLLPGLHQLDIHSDGSGWYEGGIRPLLSIHHWAGTGGFWHRFPVHFGHLVVDVCGDECFLQRYMFADDVVLTNGFSVTRYPKGTEKVDFNLVESTFQPKGDKLGFFDYSFGKLRPALGEKEKVSWRLELAVRDGNRVRQFYIKRKAHGGYAQRLASKVESVFEIEWRT